MKIELKHTGGPYGDACSKYDVVFPEGTTVLEFAYFIIADYSVHSHDTWGFLELGKDNRWPVRLLEYDCGIVKYCVIPLFEKISNKVISKITASGGWSRMDYTIYLED